MLRRWASTSSRESRITAPAVMPDLSWMPARSTEDADRGRTPSVLWRRPRLIDADRRISMERAERQDCMTAMRLSTEAPRRPGLPASGTGRRFWWVRWLRLLAIAESSMPATINSDLGERGVPARPMPRFCALFCALCAFKSVDSPLAVPPPTPLVASSRNTITVEVVKGSMTTWSPRPIKANWSPSIGSSMSPTITRPLSTRIFSMSWRIKSSELPSSRCHTPAW
mmetsp:Transcript_21562/g.50741  ORF Transcript_21562/g.50741 Transcript_21562/m.50741 type:complete len:226 (-) Transcript_21562:135-812(-)